jgi:hypothetical protein
MALVEKFLINIIFALQTLSMFYFEEKSHLPAIQLFQAMDKK